MNAFVTDASNTALASASVANSQQPVQAIDEAPELINEVDVLAQKWEQAKQAEEHAKERRYQIESQLVELVGVADEGTINAEGQYYKVKTVGKLSRSLDDSAIQADWDDLPPEIKKCIKWKAALDTKSLRSLEEMRADLMPTMSQYMTTKPAKPSVKVEAI